MAEKLDIVYETGQSRGTLPVMGAFGGPAPDQSAIVAHIYTESPSVPSLTRHDIGEGGAVDMSHGEPISRGHITRTILATLVLTPQAAKRLGAWLLAHGNRIEPDDLHTKLG